MNYGSRKDSVCKSSASRDWTFRTKTGRPLCELCCIMRVFIEDAGHTAAALQIVYRRFLGTLRLTPKECSQTTHLLPRLLSYNQRKGHIENDLVEESAPSPRFLTSPNCCVTIRGLGQVNFLCQLKSLTAGKVPGAVGSSL